MPTPLPTPTPATSTQGETPSAPPRIRCLQRPTGEWFTFEPGADLPDATALITEAEARRGLADLGFEPDVVEQALAFARAHAEVSGDETVPNPSGV